MTRKEAIAVLKGYIENPLVNDTKAFEMAIKALEQEPKTDGDCISREDALLALTGIDLDKKSAEELIALFIHRIKDLPPVNPQEPKTGRWSIVSDGYGDSAYVCECSECKDTVWVYKDADRKWNYCPNCGAKMESEVSE